MLWNYTSSYKEIFTARVRSAREGNVFTGVCPSTVEGSSLVSGLQTLVLSMGGWGYPCPSPVWGRRGGGRGTPVLVLSGWGGTPWSLVPGPFWGEGYQNGPKTGLPLPPPAKTRTGVPLSLQETRPGQGYPPIPQIGHVTDRIRRGRYASCGHALGYFHEEQKKNHHKHEFTFNTCTVDFNSMSSHLLQKMLICLVATCAICNG